MKQILTIFKLFISKKIKITFLLITINILLLFLYAAIWPSMSAKADELNVVISTMPKEFLTAFNAEFDINAGFEGLLITKQFGLILPILGFILANSFAIHSFAGEIEKGSVLLYFNIPISRGNYLLIEVLSSSFMILLFSLFSVLSTIPVAEFLNLDYSTKTLVTISISTFLFSIALYSISLLFSVINSYSSKVTQISTLIFFLFYIFNIIYQLAPDFEKLKYFTLFYYFGPKGDFIEYSILVFLTIFIMLTSFSYYLFSKRDISIR